jgi:hypothetical protein
MTSKTPIAIIAVILGLIFTACGPEYTSNDSEAKASQDSDTLVSHSIEDQLPSTPTPDPSAPLGSAENPIAREPQG